LGVFSSWSKTLSTRKIIRDEDEDDEDSIGSEFDFHELRC
jgi:hypothetical protein